MQAAVDVASALFLEARGVQLTGGRRKSPFRQGFVYTFTGALILGNSSRETVLPVLSDLVPSLAGWEYLNRVASRKLRPWWHHVCGQNF